MMLNNIGDCVTLRNGIKMPWLGLGVFQMTEPGEAEKAIICALEEGYRSIDTAAFYQNEKEVGRGIRNSGVAREDVFLTTKVWTTDIREGSVRAAFDASLKKLGMDYIDLYLVHWPVADCYKAAWDVLQEIHNEGLVRAIGVSNFMEEHIDDLLLDSDIVPVVNQIEYHPRLVQPQLMHYCQSKSIQIEAWSPLMQGGVFAIKEIRDIASKYGKTMAQVILRWNLQNSVVTIPKSSREDRIKENADIFNFQLEKEDMECLESLNRNERVGPNPRDFDF